MRRLLLCLTLAACTNPPAEWDTIRLDTKNNLYQFSGLWAVSQPDVFRYDGKKWVLVGSPGAEHIAWVADDDVWGVARGGSWFHYDGKTWTNGRVPSVAAAYRDFWGVVAWKGEAWATAGEDGTYHRHDGSDWSVVKVPELAGWDLERITSIGRHVYVALMHGEGETGKRKYKAALGHFDGEKWSVIDHAPGMRIRGSAPDDVWLVGGSMRHFDGQSWNETTIPQNVLPYDMYARSKTEAYLVGKNGLAMKWDGKTWRMIYSGTRNDLYGVTGGPEGPVWAAGPRGAVLRYPRAQPGP